VTEGRWSLLSPESYAAPFVFAWVVAFATSATAWVFLIRFAKAVVEGETSTTTQSVVGSFLSISVTSIVLQEGLKVLLITFVSQQYLPKVTALERTPLREGIRLCARGLAGVTYALLRAL